MTYLTNNKKNHWQRTIITVALIFAMAACAQKKDDNNAVISAPVPTSPDKTPDKSQTPDKGNGAQTAPPSTNGPKKDIKVDGKKPTSNQSQADKDKNNQKKDKTNSSEKKEQTDSKKEEQESPANKAKNSFAKSISNVNYFYKTSSETVYIDIEFINNSRLQFVGTSTFTTSTNKRELRTHNQDAKGTWTCESYRSDGYTCLKSVMELSYKNSSAIIEISDNNFDFNIQTREDSCAQSSCKEIVSKLNNTSALFHYMTQYKVKNGNSGTTLKFYTLKDELLKLSLRKGKIAGSQEVSLALNQFDLANSITDVKSNTELQKKIKAATVIAVVGKKTTVQLVTFENDTVVIDIIGK